MGTAFVGVTAESVSFGSGQLHYRQTEKNPDLTKIVTTPSCPDGYGDLDGFHSLIRVSHHQNRIWIYECYENLSCLQRSLTKPWQQQTRVKMQLPPSSCSWANTSPPNTHARVLRPGKKGSRRQQHHPGTKIAGGGTRHTTAQHNKRIPLLVGPFFLLYVVHRDAHTCDR